VGTLRLLIEKASNLPDTDTKGGATNVADAYVEATVGKTKHKTAIIKNNANPVWKAEKPFDIPVDLKDKSPTGKLLVHVWDGKDSFFDFSGTHSLGTVEIDIKDAWGNTPSAEMSKEFTLETTDSKLHSTITLKGTFIPKPPPKPVAGKPPSAKLNKFTLTVSGASGLENLDKKGESDPYAQVKLANVTKKGETIKNNLNPVWTKLKDLEFQVDLKDPKKSTLHIEVWDDKESMFDSTHQIGSVDIPLATSDWKTQIGNDLEKDVDIMVNKVKKGTIHLKGKLDP